VGSRRQRQQGHGDRARQDRDRKAGAPT
jgi:hypothetical protein